MLPMLSCLSAYLLHSAPGQSRAVRVPMMMVDNDGDGTFRATSSPVKNIVSGLTAAVNAIGGKDADPVRRQRTGVVTPARLLEGIEADYVERMYLWTGDIDEDLYDDECRFTDPTLSFKGLATFQKNLANLQPFLQALVKAPEVELYTINLDEQAKQVRATWRMKGDLALPWRPTIDLKGRTTFTYDESEQVGGRVVDYEEAWELSAGDALMQLLRPGGGSNGSSRGGGADGGRAGEIGDGESDVVMATSVESSMLDRLNAFLDRPILDTNERGGPLEPFKKFARQEPEMAQVAASTVAIGGFALVARVLLAAAAAAGLL